MVLLASSGTAPLGTLQQIGVIFAALILAGGYLYAFLNLGKRGARWFLRISAPLVLAFLLWRGEQGAITLFFGLGTGLITAIDLLADNFKWQPVVMRTLAALFLGAVLSEMYPAHGWIDNLVTLMDTMF
jgi:hypothetical protein